MIVGLVAAGIAPSPAQGSPGDIDPTFGTAGSAIIELPGSQHPSDLVVAEDGSIIAAGWYYSSEAGEYVSVLAKVLPDGTPDGKFGDSGMTTYSGLRPTDLALSESGGVLMSGYAGELGRRVLRFDEAGELDSGFGGGDGVVETTRGAALTELPGGDIIVLGSDFGLTKLDAAGHVDTSFESEATDLPEPGAAALELLPSGRIAVAGGASENGWSSDVAVAVFNPDGSLRDEFAGDGADFYPEVGCCQERVREIDSRGGKVFVFGISFEETHYFSGGLVAAFKADGSLDREFANDGWQSRGLGEYNSFSGGFVTDDEVVATGYVESAYDPGEIDWPDAFLFGVGLDGLPTAGFPGDGRFDSDVGDLPNFGGPSEVVPGDQSFVNLGSVAQPGKPEPTYDLVLTRFELSDSLGDRDGDAILDDQDECQPTFGPPPSGCPSYERSLEIYDEYGSIQVSAVRMDGSTAACSGEEHVVLKRISRHGRKPVEDTRFDKFGCQDRFAYEPKRPVRVAAFVKLITEPRVGLLSRARSEWIDVAPEPGKNR